MNKAAHRGLWPLETSPEVQNRGISGPTKRTYVLQLFFEKSLFSNCLAHFTIISINVLLT